MNALALLAATAAAPAGKAATQVGQHAPGTPGLFGAVLALLLVLALVVGLGWLLRRLPGSGFRASEGMKLVSSLAVGGKERLVVLEIDGRQLLLGVTAGGIAHLHTLEAALPPPPALRVPDLKTLPDFARLLQQRLRKDT